MQKLRRCTKSINPIRTSLLLVALASFWQPLSGQAAPSTPTSGAASPQNAQSTDTLNTDLPTTTLRSTVRRVVEDVVVTDRKGKPVTGLKADDFTVEENGVPQTVRNFDVHQFVVPAVVKQPPPIALPPNTFANIVQSPADSPVTVILYDVLNTPRESLPYAHDALVNFVKKERSQSRIAIFVLGDELRMLQGFTDDQTKLLNAINSKAARTQQSNQLLGNTASSDAMAEFDTDTGSDVLANLNSLETEEQNFLQQQRLEMTVAAFTQIARFVSALSGRKSLIWLSGSFPSSVLPSSDAGSGSAAEFGNSYDYSEKVKEAEDLLNLNHVAVYPVDVRGLQVAPTFSAASNAKGTPSSRPAVVPSIYGNAEHATMDMVAEDTGGKAFYNTNGLEDAMLKAQAEGANYYTLTYSPTNAKQDGAQHKIKIKLRETGYDLSYRHSYYAEDAAHPVIAAVAPVNPADPKLDDPEHSVFLDHGMQHGAPISSELIFVSQVVPVGAPVPATDGEMKSISKFQAETSKGRKHLPVGPEPVKVQHYRIDYAIQGKELSLPAAGDGKYTTNMTFALAAYLPNSELVNGMEVRVKNQITAEKVKKIKTQGYHAGLDFAIPVDASALRIAVRDGIGNRIGSIELPLPIAAPKAPAPPPPAAAPKLTDK